MTRSRRRPSTPPPPPDLRAEIADFNRITLPRLSAIAQTAAAAVGSRLTAPPPGMPPDEIANAARVAQHLRPPTIGNRESDAAFTLHMHEPITRAALWSLLAPPPFITTMAVGSYRGAHVGERLDPAAFREELRLNCRNPESFDPDTWGIVIDIDEQPGLAPLRPLWMRMFAAGLLADMDLVLSALTWLDQQMAADEPGGVTLLDLVARAMPRDVAPNSVRRNPIAPSFKNVARIENLEGWHAALTAGDAARAGGLLTLNGGVAASAALPSLGTSVAASALQFYDLAAAADLSRHGLQTHTPGRGAPLTQRLFTEVLLAAPAAERAHPGGMRFVVALAEMMDWLWPNGWRRGRDLPQLRTAMMAVDRLTIPFTSPPAGWAGIARGPGYWRPILFEGALLADDEVDHQVAIRVQLPAGSEYGPQIDRSALRMAGLDSAPMYRMLLSLTYLWHRTAVKGHPIRAVRGVLDDLRKSGSAAWRARRAAEAAGRVERNPSADRIPVLGPDERVALAYPSMDRSVRSARAARERTGSVLRSLEDRGLVVIERENPSGRPLRDQFGAPGWRILPGPRWLQGEEQTAADRSTHS